MMVFNRTHISCSRHSLDECMIPRWHVRGLQQVEGSHVAAIVMDVHDSAYTSQARIS